MLVHFLIRIKKLIDMEALSLSRLKLVVLDMQRDPKSFNLFTLPQVRYHLRQQLRTFRNATCNQCHFHLIIFSYRF